MGNVIERKVRSDKKRAVASPLSMSDYDEISRISYILDMPMKTVAEFLCIEAFNSSDIIDNIQHYFRRDLQWENRYIFGVKERKAFKPRIAVKKRLYMRFLAADHDKVSSLAFALDSSIQMASSLLLGTMIRRKDILFKNLARLVEYRLSDRDREKVKSVATYLTLDSQENITVPMVIAYIIEKSLKEKRRLDRVLQELLKAKKI
ncbi:hypothetical protein BK126_26415 [Paenibacillus sp. FSL H7-0326]|uniref:hypothetical protein n=1 Tax=Paenibacillus sp. FSL H7-0326 TaxID=1921144 RepID=UPI00096FD2BE|nr:hypothetical protein [Paenibacillus sp. FSL H7-0326]OMC63730.1 hypothetical protein BK126_26415 [Paenibacillus sp. FSL H7-0326]